MIARDSGVFGSPANLAELHREARALEGVDRAEQLLFACGFAAGLGDGERAARGQLRSAVRAIPMSLGPGGGTLLVGSLTRGREAALPSRSRAASGRPGCFVTAGYTAGWYSALLDGLLLVREVACVAAGDSECRFEARPAEEWSRCGSEAAEWAQRLAARLEEESLHLDPAPSDDAFPESLEMLGEFDAMSPVPHVWGPVAILPYTGGEDADLAFEAIRADLGDEVGVVVVDVIGFDLDGVELAGLVGLIARLEAAPVEVVLAGLSPQAAESLLRARACEERRARLELPLVAPTVARAIAVAFQLCREGAQGARAI